MSRAAELARCRAACDLSALDCRIWFGVGLATIERVEAGEIVPGAELEQRIDRFLQVCQRADLPLPPRHSLPPFAHCGGNLDAGAAPMAPASFCRSVIGETEHNACGGAL